MPGLALDFGTFLCCKSLHELVVVEREVEATEEAHGQAGPVSRVHWGAQEVQNQTLLLRVDNFDIMVPRPSRRSFSKPPSYLRPSGNVSTPCQFILFTFHYPLYCFPSGQ